MIYGIDLGTTNSVLALYDPQKERSVRIGRLLPSVVNMLTGDAGQEQKEDLSNNRNTDRILSSFKVDISNDAAGKPSIEASALVLAELKKHMRDNERDVVITVPAYFVNGQRQATKIAAEKAGLNVIALINEPTAAALYYYRDIKDKAVVYDLGGGTFDVTVIDTRFGLSDVQSTGGSRIGGDDLNRLIFRQLCAACGFKPHRLVQADERPIIEQCEALKLQIQKEHTTIRLDFSALSFASAFESTVFELTPEKYRTLVETVFGPTLSMMKKVAAKSGYSLDDLKLILVGGSTRDPYLIEMISHIKIPEPVCYNPDEIVAQGAAYFAYLKHKGLADVTVLDITQGLGVELRSGRMRTIIEPGSNIPIANTVMLRNSDDTEMLTLKLLQGDSELAPENVCIGELLYDYGRNVPKDKGLVCVSVYVSADGIISLSAQESLAAEKKIEIASC